MNDFEGARTTLRQFLIAFEPKLYGSYTRQAQFILQEVEKAAAVGDR